MALHVISLGGSLIVPEKIDTDFLASFKQFIIKRIENELRTYLCRETLVFRGVNNWTDRIYDIVT